jgi:type IV pilus assembly protein PilB
MSTLKRIGDLLVEKGLITKEQLSEALKQQIESGKKLGEVLIDQGMITEDDLVDVISTRLGIPKISLNSLVIDPSVVELVPLSVAKKHQLIPIFRIGAALTVAMVDPLDVIALDELKYITNLKINRVVATSHTVSSAIDQYYSVKDSMAEVIRDMDDDEIGPVDLKKAQQEAEAAAQSEAPLIKLVNLLIIQAVKEKASDIHIEPEEDKLRIRYRVNGVLKEETAPPKKLHSGIISRLKVMAQMDVSEKRLPQDGRFSVKVGNIDIDVRASTLPTINGEKAVLRILDKRNLLLGMENLGFDNLTKDRFQTVIRKPEGLILITGPTGSGKTTTLYATLEEIKNIEKNIITIEDPVEYSLPLINQVQINEKSGLNYASTLRSILRQNPDIIMVGEIRDSETAHMAVRSALTGHLVFSTLHTNDAASAVARLLDMGIEPYLLSTCLLGILAQRLVRTVCPSCKQPDTLPQPVIDMLELDSKSAAKFSVGEGCEDCRNTGYMGRNGIYEFLMVDSQIREMILSGESSDAIKNIACQAGMLTIWEQARSKGLDGITTYKEILRVARKEKVRELVENVE